MQEIEQVEPPSVVISTDAVTDKDKDEKHGLALCLSGGGYRAALFHLGVMRCLHEMGILQTVTTISSVSGGSIISAYIARMMFEKKMEGAIQFTDWENDVAKGFRAFVLNDIRTFPMLLHLPWNWVQPKWRAAHLERKYDRQLLPITKDGKRASFLLGDLPQKPRFVFCATDLTFGVNWEFKRDEVGDFQVGYARKQDWRVAKAVAASSCFPPLFGPIKLKLIADEFKRGKYQRPDRKKLLQNLQLTDGGVYDNFGVEPAKNHDLVFISDGGSPFGYMGTAGPIKRLMRYMPVIMNQVGGLRKRMFFTDITNKVKNGAYFNIAYERKRPPAAGSFDGYADETVRSMIAAMRTDLDAFSEGESCVLENHGYHETARRIAEKLPGLVTAGFKLATPHPNWEPSQKVQQALRLSHKRKLFGISLPG